MQNADLSIVNLEAPLTDHNVPIIKTGPSIKLSPDRISTLVDAGVDAVTLANNHILDYGGIGVKDTIELCKKNNIDVVGAGENIKEASRVLYKNVKGKKIAFINFAENEWASATHVEYGANPMDLIDNARAIKLASQSADFVVVIIHGGHEFYRYPSPRMVKQYRFYAEQGASIIVGHHTHCASGYEIHGDVPIFYSLGNLFFPSKTAYEDWYEGFLLKIVIENDILGWELIPYEQNKEKPIIEILNGKKKIDFESKIDSINNTISNPVELNRVWNEYCSKQGRVLLTFLIPFTFFAKVMRKFNIAPPKMLIKPFALVLNIFRCESYRDVMFITLDRFVNSRDKC